MFGATVPRPERGKHADKVKGSFFELHSLYASDTVSLVVQMIKSFGQNKIITAHELWLQLT